MEKGFEQMTRRSEVWVEGFRLRGGKKAVEVDVKVHKIPKFLYIWIHIFPVRLAVAGYTA